jgi:hypothetical protein
VEEKSHSRSKRHVRSRQIRHGPAGHGGGQSPDVAPRVAVLVDPGLRVTSGDVLNVRFDV